MKNRYDKCRNYIRSKAGNCYAEVELNIQCSECPNFKGKAKYGNQKVVIDGIKFDSIKEADYFGTLKILEHSGAIKDLKLQPVFELQPAFNKNGVHYRAITYRADFSYVWVKTGLKEIVDVKGARTKEYLIKRKLYEYKFSGTIKEV